MAKKEKVIGITVKKSKDFSEWYTQVIQKSELADYAAVSGCMVIRPRAYAIWEKIQNYFDVRIKKAGVKNAYFPLLIPEHLLMKEKEHIEGFSPEVAWVTHAGKSKLKEKLAIRPTSETIMYVSYKKWIKSHRDLPLMINQWNNVVRWEFKHPMPFIRTREFLWQEGHSAFATKQEADKEVIDRLNLYADVYEKLLAVPVLKGKKSEKEKFAGALYTLSVEAFLPNGKAAQCATSHNLGQNFSKAFGITYLDEKKKKNHVWQTSWGLSTRAIGMMVMFHSDDKGLVIPPNVAPVDVVIIPILYEKTKKKIIKKAKQIKSKLKGYNVILDLSDHSPGWKFHDWELKGVPIRVEIGPRDVEKKQVVMVRRDTGKKQILKIVNVNKEIKKTLGSIQNNLFKKAKKFLESSIVKVSTMDNLKKAVKDKKLALVAFCGEKGCEDWIKDKTGGAKSINIPSKQPKKLGKCIYCNKKAKYLIYFAKSY